MSWDIESAINLKIQKKRKGQDIVHYFKALGNFYKVVTDPWKSVLHSVGFLPGASDSVYHRVYYCL